ncbi:MAG: hypothetical protein KJ042_06665 [Deltaproteobacteria bacterium]|nr:hypothetical protein [Deltaproteobacteria bacterium]
MQTAWPILTGRDAARIAALTIVAVTVIAVVGPWLHLGLVDDAFITFRCSANFAAGHGLVYNVGEPVESASNFLFALLIGLAMKLGAPPEFAAFGLNTFAIALMLVALRVLAWPRAQSAAPSRFPIGLAGIILVTQPAVWFYLSSGMETLFFSAFVFAGFAALVLRVERGISPAWTGIALGIASCVRMEAVAFVGLAAAVFFAFEKGVSRWKSPITLSLVFAAVFGPALAWRWSFYGYPFPNAYYAKVDGGGADLWLRGIGYVGLWLILNWLALATVIFAARVGLRTSRIRTRVALGLAWIGAYAAYNTYVGGDYFPYHRFFVPVLPVVAWLAEGLWSELDRRRAERSNDGLARYRVRAVVLLAVATCVTAASAVTAVLRHRETTGLWQQVGVALRGAVPADTFIYLMPAGALPYESGLRAYDSHGLADPVLAHRPVDLGKGFPGHEKMDLARISELHPDLIYMGPLLEDTDKITVPVDMVERLRREFAPKKDGFWAERQRKFIEDRLANVKNYYAFFTDEAFQARYRPGRLVGFEPAVAFWVRRDASEALQSAFSPIEVVLEKPADS